MKKTMDHKQKGALAVAIAAGVGGMTVAGDASAAQYSATLKSAALHTSSTVSGSVLNLSSSTGWVTGTAGGMPGWIYDDVTNLMTQQGAGLLNIRSQTAPTSTLFRQSITGLVIGNGAAASATTFVCTEGNFGLNVNATICGNYVFGANSTDESTASWGPGTAVSRVIGGDDAPNGVTGVNDAVQSIADLNGMNGSVNGSELILTNRTCNTLVGTNCNGTTTFNIGYRYTFELAPLAVPEAVDDGPIDVAENVAKAIHVGANDLNFSNPVTITRILPDPTQGTALVTTASGNAADVVITYTANDGATGPDFFDYRITDGTNTEEARVTVNILAFGANNDDLRPGGTRRGVPVVIYPARNDLGYDPDTVTITEGACTPGGGTIEVTDGNGGPKANVQVTYTPPINSPDNGSPVPFEDTCAYTIGNGGAQPSTSANIILNVTNSVPLATAGTASSISTAGVAPAGRTATFTSPGTGAGASLGDAGVTSTANGTHGTAAVAPGGHVITYTVTDNSFFTGSDTFTYTVTDADGAASDEISNATVTVNIADVQPTIANGAITAVTATASAAFSPVIVAGNGSLAQHTLAVSSNGAHGSCTLSAPNGTGTLSYTSAAGYTGTDSCQLTLTDGDGDPAVATINITVNADSAIKLPGGGSSMDLWSFSLLGSLPLLLRRRRRS